MGSPCHKQLVPNPWAHPVKLELERLPLLGARKQLLRTARAFAAAPPCRDGRAVDVDQYEGAVVGDDDSPLAVQRFKLRCDDGGLCRRVDRDARMGLPCMHARRQQGQPCMHTPLAACAPKPAKHGMRANAPAPR
jgi:hypothetical protein